MSKNNCFFFYSTITWNKNRIISIASITWCRVWDYAGDVKLPLELAGGNNPVLDLNVHVAATANNVNVQQTLNDLVQLNADYMKSPFELTAGNNQILNLNEENDDNNDNEDENDKDNEED